MLKQVRSTFRKIITNYFFGRRSFQSFFERLHRLSLAGMNFGVGADVYSSGEKIVINYVARHLDKDITPVVFDVGAHIGKYSLEVISVLGKNVLLYCFEPSKKAFTSLTRNLRDYKNVKVYNLGFGEKDKTVAFYSDTEGSELGSVFPRRLNHFGIELRYREEIKLRRLDDFCEEIGIDKIHLLKLDVEGNEFNILMGAKRSIESNLIYFIQFEFGGCNIDSRTYFQDFFYLLNPNYRIHRILKDRLMPVDTYNETHEIFLSTNYLAVSRRM